MMLKQLCFHNLKKNLNKTRRIKIQSQNCDSSILYYNIGEYLSYLELRKDFFFLDPCIKSINHKGKINKFDYIKMKSLGANKDII